MTCNDCLQATLTEAPLGMSDHEEVVEANRSFYRAFETLDVENMERVWLRDPKIVCIHPGWRTRAGWGPIMSSWAGIFDVAFEMTLKGHEQGGMTGGDLAAAVTEER